MSHLMYPTTLAEARLLFGLALEKIGPPVVTDDNEADLAPTVEVSAAELRAALDEAFAEADAMFQRHAAEDEAVWALHVGIVEEGPEDHGDLCMCMSCMDCTPGRRASDEYRRLVAEAEGR